MIRETQRVANGHLFYAGAHLDAGDVLDTIENMFWDKSGFSDETPTRYNYGYDSDHFKISITVEKL